MAFASGISAAALGRRNSIHNRAVLTAWVGIKILFTTSLLRAIKCWLPTLIVDAALLALLYLFIEPYVLGAYVMPTQAMAPTLLGPHQHGVCPHCGQTATVSFDVDRPFREWTQLGMCSSCQQAGEMSTVKPMVQVPDRFLVNRLLTPRRWDLVVFRSLERPSDRHVKRLVGLPGEEVVIKDGGIWINGVRQEPPAEIARLSFSAEEQDLGSPQRPAQLGADEYFVVGDFAP